MDLDRRAVDIEDLHRLARRRLPRIVFDYIEGGVGEELCLSRNREAFHRPRLLPRYLADVAERDLSATLLGRTHALPFGIAPTGANGLARHGADVMLAAAAEAAGIPVIRSGASNSTIEELGRTAPQGGWYQLYVARDRRISEDMVRRARDAGIGTLVITVDVPVRVKRERNIRNGFGPAPRITPRLLLDALRHPAWSLGYLLHGGAPRMEDWAPYAPPNADASALADFVWHQFPDPDHDWRDLEHWRRLWTGRLVVKGILRPEQALRCAELGADGVIVSNHGGRQLDQAPPSLEMLPHIVAALAGRDVAVMMDSGVRRGADVLLALCLGARFVFVGRATLYGAAVAGQPGVARAIAILREELDLLMTQIGCARVADLGPDFLLDPPEAAMAGNPRPARPA